LNKRGDIETDHHPILKVLESESWTELAQGLRQSQAYLRDIVPGNPLPKQVIDRIMLLANHPKWEVRQACAETLGVVVNPKATHQLQQLSKDVVPFVRRAAEKSLREARRVTIKVYEKRDPTGEHLFALIKRLNPHNIREAYAAALQVGQIYYRELAAITAHELRTSIFSMSGLIKELLEHKHTADVESEEINMKLHQLMENLLKIVGGLSDLTRDPEKEEVIDTMQIVQQAATEADSAFRAANDSTTQIIWAGALVEAKVKGDPSRLLQALRNLILNALEASPHDRNVTIACSKTERLFMVSIKDEGAGMTEQQIEDAFKPFSSLKRESGHTGMGIPIAQRVIHFDFSGELRFVSEVGVGTEARVELLLHKGDQ